MSGNDQHQFKDRYMLRLPDGMRDRIKAAAEANNRSMNAEIVARLEQSLARDDRPSTEQMQLAALTQERMRIEEEIAALEAARKEAVNEGRAMLDAMLEVAKVKFQLLSERLHRA